jgi:hypothetical protein
LAGKPQFFGDTLAETISAAVTAGSWNGDYATSVNSTNPWLVLGGRSSLGSSAGVFAFSSSTVTGGDNAILSHRTILSGY